MKSFPAPDSYHLSAAVGWLGLGNWQEANEELEKITPALRGRLEVLEVRFQVYARAEKWDTATEIAAALVKMQPNEPQAWINLAYATRRKAGGGIPQAKEVLVPVEKRFPNVWVIPYNLACYSAQLGLLDECQEWFKKAMAIDEQTVKRAAIDDPDLTPLWDSMRGTVWKRME
jgi:tetratricopeptide (TPR) repeat protein